jgi:hypothetical protein
MTTRERRPVAVETVASDDTLAVLKAAREWLSDPQHWTGYLYWEGADGLGVDTPGDVRRTCAVGALSLASGAERWSCNPPGTDVLRSALGGSSPVKVSEGQDGYDRILAGYDKAIATLSEEAKTDG